LCVCCNPPYPFKKFKEYVETYIKTKFSAVSVKLHNLCERDKFLLFLFGCNEIIEIKSMIDSFKFVYDQIINEYANSVNFEKIAHEIITDCIQLLQLEGSHINNQSIVGFIIVITYLLLIFIRYKILGDVVSEEKSSCIEEVDERFRRAGGGSGEAGCEPDHMFVPSEAYSDEIDIKKTRLFTNNPFFQVAY
jgi:hypothetical protein